MERLEEADARRREVEEANQNLLEKVISLEKRA